MGERRVLLFGPIEVLPLATGDRPGQGRFGAGGLRAVVEEESDAVAGFRGQVLRRRRRRAIGGSHVVLGLFPQADDQQLPGRDPRRGQNGRDFEALAADFLPIEQLGQQAAGGPVGVGGWAGRGLIGEESHHDGVRGDDSQRRVDASDFHRSIRSSRFNVDWVFLF